MERVIDAVNTLFHLEKEVDVALYYLREEVGYRTLKRVLRALSDNERDELEEKLKVIKDSFCSFDS